MEKLDLVGTRQQGLHETHGFLSSCFGIPVLHLSVKDFVKCRRKWLFLCDTLCNHMEFCIFS